MATPNRPPARQLGTVRGGRVGAQRVGAQRVGVQRVGVQRVGARRVGARRAAAAWLVPLLLAALLLPQMPWFGCSPQRRYEVLSLFFDGVPDPSKPRGEAGDEIERDAQGNPIVRASSFAHKPFEDGNCSACHANPTGSFSEFDKVDQAVCLNCHPGVPNEYPRMHGPVALAQCSLCHLPHESSIRPLLRDQPAALCTTCHVRETLPAAPPDHFTNRSCLDCHWGHGGTGPALLRGEWSATPQPTTAETTR